MLSVPEFVAVGHLTLDTAEDGRTRPGGAALYAGLLAWRLGLRVGLLTSFGPDFPPEVIPPDVEVVSLPAPATTTFHLAYRGSAQRLRLEARASPISRGDFPLHWTEARLAYLCPVADEVDPGLSVAFPEAGIGVGAQGWVRRWDPSGEVRARPWEDPAPVLRESQALFLSRDDIRGWEVEALALYQQVPVGALTFGADGAILFVNGERYPVTPAPAREVEPTGAGDVFAAAFLIRYAESQDPWEAAGYAAAAGALVVEGEGISGVPSAEALAARWEAYRRLLA